ncbi:MAG TPA: AI-2E family transporter, partial [Anaerolineae bacterium]|nr:AI-2E family transporter [Anaerolineae bacterium]
MIFNQWRGWPARQWARAALAGVVGLGVVAVLYRVRGALLPFALGLGLAYLALPAVDWLEDHAPRPLRRGTLARSLAIIVVYVVALGLTAAFFAYLVPVIIGQVEQLIAQREQIIGTVQTQLVALYEWYRATIPTQVQATVESRLQDAGDALLKALQSGIVGGLVAVGNTVSLVLGYLAIPFWLFFVLHDARDYRRAAHDLMPERIRPDIANVGRIIDNVLSGYLRGQLIVASVTGALTAIALSIIGVEFAVFLGFMVAVLDLIPSFGPV